MRITTRRADAGDIPWLLIQLERFSSFQGTRLQLYGNQDVMIKGLTNLILNHFVLLAQHTEARVGFIAGVCTPHPFNPAITLAAEQFWWVMEPYRHSRAGLVLLNGFVDWAKSVADWITFGLEANSPVNDRTLTRRGFRLQERAYLMEVN